MIKKKVRQLCLFFPVILILLFDASLIVAKQEVIFTAIELYKATQGGIRVVKTRNDEKVLFLKSKELSKDQKKLLERFRSLGYMQGASTAGFKNEPQIKLSVNSKRIGKIIIKVKEVKEKFSLRVSVNTNDEELLFREEYIWTDLEKFLNNNQGEIIIEPNLHGYTKPLIVYLEFESCDLVIYELRFM